METPTSISGNVQTPIPFVNDGEQTVSQLRRACRNNDFSVVKSLLEQGVNANVADRYEMTALHLACGFGNLKIVQALLSHRKDTTTKSSEAIDGQVNLDAKDSVGQTALHLAAIGGHKEIVDEFIKDPRSKFDATDDDGWTPLMSATQRGHAVVVKQLLPISNINIADKTGETPLMVAKKRNYLEIVEIFWTHLCDTSSLNSGTSNDLLAWASEDFKRHDLANAILSREGAESFKPTESPSAIERAAVSYKPGVLWWLIATSPHKDATKRVEQARYRIKTTQQELDSQQTIAEARLVTKRKGTEGNTITVFPRSQHASTAPTAPTKCEVSSEILDILENPPFEVAYQHNPFDSMPEPKELTKHYRAHIRKFFKNESASSTICKVLSVEDVVYRRGPDDIMKERVQAEMKYMERGQQATITPDLYNEENSQFTWIHLPATRMDWMEHLAQKIASAEKGPIKDKYSEIKSFLQGTWFQIPDQQAKSRIMRPGFAKRTFDHMAKAEEETQDHGEPKICSCNSSEPEQNMTNDENSVTCSASYMPFLSFSTQLVESSQKATSEDPTQTRHSEELRKRFTDARSKYDKLMRKCDDDSQGHSVAHPVIHPVVHGCPTLDEAFYHFAKDKESQDEEKSRNENQVVSKQLGASTDSNDKRPYPQPILRVSQMWIWTISDKWIISACSHPVDDVEELWVDGFIDHLQKDAKAKGALAQPSSAQEMIRKMIMYCIGSYERRRTYREVDASGNKGAETKIQDLTHGLSIRQLFWDYVNQTGRKETSLFDQNHNLMERYQDNSNKKLYTNNSRDLVKSVKQAIFTAEKLFSEVKDIRDELGILRWIVSCQETVQKGVPKPKKNTSELTVKYVLNDIDRMEQLASRIQENANSTLSLLQNETATLETEEALNQGRVFMVFTVLTIVFLPMSFLTSLFAMEADQINSQPGWSFGVIFGAGVLITIPSIIFTWPWTTDWLRPIFEFTSQSSDASSYASKNRASDVTTSTTCWSALRFAGPALRNRKQSSRREMDVEKGQSS